MSFELLCHPLFLDPPPLPPPPPPPPPPRPPQPPVLRIGKPLHPFYVFREEVFPFLSLSLLSLSPPVSVVILMTYQSQSQSHGDSEEEEEEEEEQGPTSLNGRPPGGGCLPGTFFPPPLPPHFCAHFARSERGGVMHAEISPPLPLFPPPAHLQKKKA